MKILAKKLSMAASGAPVTENDHKTAGSSPLVTKHQIGPTEVLKMNLRALCSNKGCYVCY